MAHHRCDGNNVSAVRPHRVQKPCSPQGWWRKVHLETECQLHSMGRAPTLLCGWLALWVLFLFSLRFSELVLLSFIILVFFLFFFTIWVNYTDGSSKLIMLDFGFDKHKYNVLQVNKTNYEKCGDKDFIENVTRGGRDVFNLTEAKPFYFICGRGDYCSKGMKISVHVETDPPPPTASPNLTISASPSPSSIHGHLLLACTIAFLSIFCSVSV